MNEKVRALVQRAKRSRIARTFSHFTDVGGNVLAAGMSYQALFAVFAGLWVGFSVFGIFLSTHKELLMKLVELINQFVPGLLGEGEEGAVSLSKLLNQTALSWTSAIAIVVLLGVAVNWFTSTRRTIRIIFEMEVREYRNAILLKLRDAALTLLFLVVIVIAAVLTIATTGIVDSITDFFQLGSLGWLTGGLGIALRAGLLFVINFVVVWGIHRVLAEVKVKRRTLLWGSALGALALLVLQSLANVLLGGTGNNPLLNSFAVIIGLLLWFNFVCRALLLTSSWIAVGANK